METFEDWEKKYTAIENPDTSAGFGGCGFETYGLDLVTVESYDPLQIWTVLEVDDELILVSGFHTINRIAYIISTEPVSHEDKNKRYVFI